MKTLSAIGHTGTSRGQRRERHVDAASRRRKHSSWRCAIVYRPSRGLYSDSTARGKLFFLSCARICGSSLIRKRLNASRSLRTRHIYTAQHTQTSMVAGVITHTRGAVITHAMCGPTQGRLHEGSSCLVSTCPGPRLQHVSWLRVRASATACVHEIRGVIFSKIGVSWKARRCASGSDLVCIPMSRSRRSTSGGLRPPTAVFVVAGPRPNASNSSFGCILGSIRPRKWWKTATVQVGHAARTVLQTG